MPDFCHALWGSPTFSCKNDYRPAQTATLQARFYSYPSLPDAIPFFLFVAHFPSFLPRPLVHGANLPPHSCFMTYKRLPFLLTLFLLSLPLNSAYYELAGHHFHGCALLENPYVVPDVTRRLKFGGVALRYLERLEDNLQFTIRLTQWERTWSAFIDHMAVCDPYSSGPNKCQCDIGVGSFTMTNERAEKINFVWALGNENHRMVSRKSDLRVDDSKNTWFVFQTFSLRVWGFIFLGIFMHAIGTVFFGPFRPPKCETQPGMDAMRARRANRLTGILWQVKRFPAAVLFSYAHLIGHPFGERSQGTPSFHRTAWLVLGVTAGLFLLTVYEASLTVLLFESTRTSPFRTLRDITDCAVPPDRVAIIRGGASQDFWNMAVNTSAQREKCKSWDQVGTTVSDLEEGFEFVKEGKADYFYSLEGSVLFRAHRDCEEFEPVGEPFFSTSVGFVMPQKVNRTILDILSRETRILREQDGYESASLLAARNSCDAVIDATITSGKLWAFFVLYSVLWSLLLLYRCVFLWRRKKAIDKHSHDSNNNNTEVVVMDMHSMPTRSITGVARGGDTFDTFDEYSGREDYSIQQQYQVRDEDQTPPAQT